MQIELGWDAPHAVFDRFDYICNNCIGGGGVVE